MIRESYQGTKLDRSRDVEAGGHESTSEALFTFIHPYAEWAVGTLSLYPHLMIQEQELAEPLLCVGTYMVGKRVRTLSMTFDRGFLELLPHLGCLQSKSHLQVKSPARKVLPVDLGAL